MKQRKRTIGLLFLALWGTAWMSEAVAQGPISIRGKVTASGSSLEGAYVAAHADGKAATTYVMTDGNGQFTFQGLAPGSYAVFTRIPGFRVARRDGVAVQAGREAAADFQVEPETNFLSLIEQASNSELQDSFPLSETERQALDHRCADCHGASYIAKSRFTLRDWQLVVAAMDDQRRTTPAGDISPPTRMSRPSARHAGAEEGPISDESIAAMLAKIRGPDSPDFPIKFRPRATGRLTRAVVTEYQIPRIGATTRAVLVDPNTGYVWYTDWRSNILGRIDPRKGEIKEYPIPAGKPGRPPGFQYLRWDPLGYLLAGQIWTGAGVRFDVKNEKVANLWQTPIEWARTGNLDVCRSNGRILYRIGDGLARQQSWLIDPETNAFTEIRRGGAAPDVPCDGGRDYNGWDGGFSPGGGKRVITYKDPATGQTREFTMPSRWSRPYNAVGDPRGKTGWSAPDVTDLMVKADLTTGEMTEWPLPSHGKEVRNIDIDLSTNPPSVWFPNQRLGRVIRFQEYVE